MIIVMLFIDSTKYINKVNKIKKYIKNSSHKLKSTILIGKTELNIN